MIERIEVLDHGYVALVETWGSDERVIEAARMSTGKGFQGWGGQLDHSGCPIGSHSSYTCKAGPVVGDEKLLAFLYNNQHMTPFEMGGLVIEVQAPIFVFREWHRHRSQSFNEMSARYTPLPDVNYVPTIERLMIGAGGSNKQAGCTPDAHQLTLEWAQEFRAQIKEHYRVAEQLYQAALIRGIPKELARVGLPVGRYSRMRASANLRNWLAFLTLRQAPNAQREIRQFANAVGALVEQAFPRTWSLFSNKEAA